jgi:hypothetical protein
MNDSNSETPERGRRSQADVVLISEDGVITYPECATDNTVRPIPPERMAQAIAERDLIQKVLAEKKAKRESSEQN